MKIPKCWFCNRPAVPNKSTCASSECKEKLSDLAVKVSKVLR